MAGGGRRILDGTLHIGSRTPVADIPAWVTLEVAHGGFATGRCLAETEPRDDELAVVAGLPDGALGTTPRERLNLWYLTDAGQAELLAALAAGAYRVDLPEDAALMVVAWLFANGHGERALAVVAALRPFLHRLRLTPRFVAAAPPRGGAVRVASVGAVAASLRGTTVKPRIAAMREAVAVWHPLYDRLVALWADTVDGEPPRLDGGTVVGGWPCRVWPPDWAERRARWLADHTVATGGRDRHPKSNFSRLRAALIACEHDSSTLSGRDVGWVRRALANTTTRRGAPGSPARAALRATQLAVAESPTHAALAGVLARRLAEFPADGGLPDVAPVVADTQDGHAIPARLVAKVTRALEASVGELVDRGVITSGDVLAAVLPQVTAGLMSANIDDPDLAALYGQTYAAFRRRRGLLLRDLAHQVRFEELPWVDALAPLRAHRPDAAGAARQTLAQTVLLAFDAFPHAILPNPLVTEFDALARQSNAPLPLVEELAADIFMGRFTKKWRAAAVVASRDLAGTLYGRYYDLPADWPAENRWWAGTTKDFTALCRERAGSARHGGTAGSGAVVEQSQILTTHNLAVLVAGLGLEERLAALAPGLADRALGWSVRRLALPTRHRHATLVALKNSAYAWRQAIFFLSHCDRAAQDAAVDRLRDRVADAGLAARFGPAVAGLAAVVDGARFTTDGHLADGRGRRFLGWTVGRHWAQP